MKKIITLTMLVVLGVLSSNAQETSKKAKTATTKVNGAGMVFVNEVIDYGTIAHNSTRICFH